MNKIIAYDGDTRHVRVTRREARKIFNQGAPVVFCPSKLYPFGGFRPSCMVQNSDAWPDFDCAVRNFEWYNCTHETGYYPAFYVARAKP